MPDDKKRSKETQEEILYLTAVFFRDRKEIVHLTLKRKDPDTGRHIFANGIIQQVRPDFILIEDRVDSLLPFFFDEILRIDIYKQEVDKNVKGDR